MIWTLIGALAGLVLFGTGSAVAEYLRDRAEARRAVREWDATILRTMGMAWNPHTLRYEKPPHTIPWTPPRRLHWWDLPMGDLFLIALCLYASWRLRKDKGGDSRG